MTSSNGSRWTLRNCLVSLVGLCPAEFRSRFGEEMAEQIGHDYDRARSVGFWTTVLFAFKTTTDLIYSALVERLSPSWPDTKSAIGKKETTVLENWTHDLMRATKSLRRSPGFSAAVIITLGIAIGVNAGIFSVVYRVLIDPLPFRDTDRLVSIEASAPGSDFPAEFGTSGEFYLQYKDSELLEDLAMYGSGTNTLRVGERAERISMTWPTPSLFTTLGADPLIGRLPVADEEGVVVLSHALWKTWFDSDPAVLGQTVYVGGNGDCTVIGVMKPEFWFPADHTMLWIPEEIRPESVRVGRFGAMLVGRTAPGVGNEGLQAELTSLALGLPERFGSSANYERLIAQHRAVVRGLQDEILGSSAGALWGLLGAVGIVLLIACANVANLFTVRAERRRGDVAVERAIGATRGQVVRSQLAEALVLSSGAGLLAVALAWATVPLLIKVAPQGVPRLAMAGISGATLIFTFTVSFLTALLCGLWPAIRSSSVDLSRLRGTGRGNTRGRHWGRTGLVVAQTALALVLLISSGLLLRSFWHLNEVDPGYQTEDIFTFQIAPEGAHLTDAAAFARFHTDFMGVIAALPGVESVGVVDNVPLNETVGNATMRTEDSGSDTTAGSRISYTWAGGDYFRTMGIKLVAGRAFTEADHTTSLGGVIVSESAANLLWPGQDPIGKRITADSEESWETVVGVVGDVLQRNFRGQPDPMAYYPLVTQGEDPRRLQSPAYVVKTERAETIAPEIRALVQDTAPNAPMYRVFTMRQLAQDSMLELSFTMLTLGVAAGLALLLGVLGLYGVLSYVVAERTREIGLRMAVGAAPLRVQLMVVAQGIRVVLVGLFLGVVVSVAATRSLSGLLYEVEAVDTATFAWTSLGMALIGLLATYVPARRASKVDPMVSLRSE